MEKHLDQIMKLRKRHGRIWEGGGGGGGYIDIFIHS